MLQGRSRRSASSPTERAPAPPEQRPLPNGDLSDGHLSDGCGAGTESDREADPSLGESCVSRYVHEQQRQGALHHQPGPVTTVQPMLGALEHVCCAARQLRLVPGDSSGFGRPIAPIRL